MVLRKLHGSTYKRMKPDPYLTPYIKINSKWIKDLNVTAKIITLRRKHSGSLAVLITCLRRNVSRVP